LATQHFRARYSPDWFTRRFLPDPPCFSLFPLFFTLFRGVPGFGNPQKSFLFQMVDQRRRRAPNRTVTGRLFAVIRERIRAKQEMTGKGQAAAIRPIPAGCGAIPPQFSRSKRGGFSPPTLLGRKPCSGSIPLGRGRRVRDRILAQVDDPATPQWQCRPARGWPASAGRGSRKAARDFGGPRDGEETLSDTRARGSIIASLLGSRRWTRYQRGGSDRRRGSSLLAYHTPIMIGRQQSIQTVELAR
jgi:hypothetical protein